MTAEADVGGVTRGAVLAMGFGIGALATAAGAGMAGGLAGAVGGALATAAGADAAGVLAGAAIFWNRPANGLDRPLVDDDTPGADAGPFMESTPAAFTGTSAAATVCIVGMDSRGTRWLPFAVTRT